MLVSNTIPNLINGVSQQPYNLRLASQAEEQENCYSSTVDALSRRPPTKHIAKFSSSNFTSAKLHTINRDTTERYQVVIVDDDLFVYDIDGTAKTVAFPDGKGYLNCSSPKTKFKCLTVADYTFVVNQEITAAMDAATSTARPKEALIWVQQGNYGKTYTIKIGGSTVASYQTPDGSSASHTANIDTAYIANELYNDLVTAIGGSYTITNLGSVIYLTKTSGDFSIVAEDGLGGTAMSVIKDSVQSFSDLPYKAIENFNVKIVGSVESNVDDYYVKFVTSNNSGGTYNGVWAEAVAPGIVYKLNPATMPHILVRESSGDFTFKRATWVDRNAGDLDSNPNPSFIGNKITDTFFFKNRLGFLSNENVIMSGAGDFFRFFQATATQLLDDDPIDVAAAHVKVSILRSAIPYNESLLLNSDQTQFILTGSDILAPRTVSITPTTEFETVRDCKPVGSGKNVYFVAPKGPWASVLEYFTDNDLQVNDASEITSHVPRYIPAGVFSMAAATNEDLICLLTSGDVNSVYVYKFYWQGNTKLQSSWSKWTFPSTDTLLAAEFIESTLYLVIQRSDGCYMERIAVESGAADTDSDYITYLDRRVTEAQCSESYDAGTDVTTITIPFSAATSDTHTLVVRGGNTNLGNPEGYMLPFEFASATTITVSGDHRTTKYYFGRNFASRYVPSTLLIRKNVGNAVVAVLEGRLQLRNGALNYDRTGYFRVNVTPLGRDTYTYIFSGRVLGSVNNIIGAVAIETGRFKFPVQAENTKTEIEIVADSHLPMFITSLEWEGFYHDRAKRIS